MRTYTWQTICLIAAIVVGVLAAFVGWGLITADNDLFSWQGLISFALVLYFASRRL